MNILMTGSRGYIGSALVPYLRDLGHKVMEHDIGVYGQDLAGTVSREAALRHLPDMDAVVLLAALAHDPKGQLDEELVLEHTWRQASAFWRAAEETASVRRIVVLSSMSVFARNTDAAGRLPAYPRAKSLLESDILRFPAWFRKTIILRPGTVWGKTVSLPPERLRSHLLLNAMIYSASRRGIIEIVGDGALVRPVVHVRRVLESITRALSDDIMPGYIHNIIDTTRTVRQYAETIQRLFGAEIVLIPGATDIRSYGWPQDFDDLNRTDLYQFAGWMVAKKTQILDPKYGLDRLYDWAKSETCRAL